MDSYAGLETWGAEVWNMMGVRRLSHQTSFNISPGTVEQSLDSGCILFYYKNISSNSNLSCDYVTKQSSAKLFFKNQLINDSLLFKSVHKT